MYNSLLQILNHRFTKIFIIVLLFGIYIASSVGPILNKTVPYTFDTARDFLKIEQIVETKDLTLLGPPAGGISGIFHGVWWYYILLIPYFIFNGWPVGYYLFGTFLGVIFNLIFFYFIRREFNFLTAVLFLCIMATSPFLLINTFFLWNVLMAPYFIILLLICISALIRTKEPYILFLMSLMLGFILQFELSLGFLIIPSAMITLVFIKETRPIFLSVRGFIFFILGFAIPLSPVVLFEVRHDFLQTKALINFFLNPTTQNESTLVGAFHERISLFIDYYKNIFFENKSIFGLIFYTLGIIGFVAGFSKMSSAHKKICFFLVCLIGFLFVFSMLNKNNFFWGYYYNGIHYFFLFLTLAGFYMYSNFNKNTHKIALIVVSLYILINVFTIFSKSPFKAPEQPLGIRKSEIIVEYIYAQAKNKDVCVKIYTPPITPYVYDYLFQYYSRTKQYNKPVTDFVDNECFYIIDDEQKGYEFRITKWRKDMIPENSKVVHLKRIQDTLIEKRQLVEE